MNNKKTILAVVFLVALVAAMAMVWFVTRPETEQGSKAITVIVVHGDGSQKEFTYKTDATKLGALLEEKKLIGSEGADPGMFHTVDGEKADWSVNKSYWAFYVGDAYAETGIYDTNITDGATYKLVYTIG